MHIQFEMFFTAGLSAQTWLWSLQGNARFLSGKSRSFRQQTTRIKLCQCLQAKTKLWESRTEKLFCWMECKEGKRQSARGFNLLLQPCWWAGYYWQSMGFLCEQKSSKEEYSKQPNWWSYWDWSSSDEWEHVVQFWKSKFETRLWSPRSGWSWQFFQFIAKHTHQFTGSIEWG